MNTAAAAPSPSQYCLPPARDDVAWRDLMRPCGGILQLVQSPVKVPIGRVRTIRLELVRVWVYCGLHYVRAPVDTTACTPPVPEDLPPLDQPNTNFSFVPLKRDKPSSRPSFSVHIFCAPAGRDIRGIDGRWVLELTAPVHSASPLRFCAGSREQAEQWERQLRMRAAPLTVVWSCHVGMPGEGNASGDGVVRAEVVGPSSLAALSAMHRAARHVLSDDVLVGVAGMATAFSSEAVHRLAVGAGPVVGMAFAGLGFFLRVLVAVQSTSGAALSVAEELNNLRGMLWNDLLPALRDLPDDGSVDVNGLMNRLGDLMADAEVISGQLHHLVRSRSARLRTAVSSALHVQEVEPVLRDQLLDCRCRADEVWRLCQLALGRHGISVAHKTQQTVIAAAEQTQQVIIESREQIHNVVNSSTEVMRQDFTRIAERVRRNDRAAAPHSITHDAAQELPLLPPNVYINWEDQTQAASRLYSAVIKADSTACAALGVRGMGGVGKTLSCLLVAHRIAHQADGQSRFPDSVHWVQLSSEVGPADVTQRVCDLATGLSGDAVVAKNLAGAVRRLYEVMRDKSCLVIVDDVWEDRWAATFLRAMGAASSSCLLISTRQHDIATRVGMAEPVSVDVLEGAQAAGVLSAHAEARGMMKADKTVELVEEAVCLCGGLALALAVLGSLVHSTGWASAVKLVRDQRELLLKTCLAPENSYDLSLRACLSASYMALGTEVDEKLLWRGRFKALCVVQPKERLPLSTLGALWEEDEGQVVSIAKILRNRSLVTLECDKGDNPICLELHDLVIAFLAGPELMDRAGRERVHVTLVANTCARSGVHAAGSTTRVGTKQVAVRAVWELTSDGFTERALPRLLNASGADAREELGILLFNWRFIAWRVKVGGGACGVYREDGRLFHKCCGGVGESVLDRVATLVEGGLMGLHLLLPARLQQAAWEVMEQTSSRQSFAGDSVAAPFLDYLGRTARSYIEKPAVELIGEARLGQVQERRVLGCEGESTCVCSFISALGEHALCVGTNDGRIEVWQEQNGSRTTVLDGHKDEVTCLVVVGSGADGRGGRLVSGSKDHTVRVWDVVRGTCKMVLNDHSSWVTCLAVVDGGAGGSRGRLVSGSLDMTLRVWDIERRECEEELLGHTGMVTCLAVVDDGAGGRGLLISGSSDKTLRVRDLERGTCKVLPGHTGRVTCLAALDGHAGGGGGRLASGSMDKTVRVWDVVSGKCLKVLRGHSRGVECLAAVGGGAPGVAGRVLSGSWDETVRVWEVEGGTCLWVLRGHTGMVSCLAVVGGAAGGGGERLMSGSSDMTVRVWDVEGGTSLRELRGHTHVVTCLAVVADGTGAGDQRFVSGSRDRTLRVWDVDGGEGNSALRGHASSVTCLAVLDGGASGARGQLVSGSVDKTVRVWDVERGTCERVLVGHKKGVTCLGVVGGGSGGGSQRVASGSFDNTVRVWDVVGGTCVKVVDISSSCMACLPVVVGGPGGGAQRLVCGSFDGTVTFIDVERGESTTLVSRHNTEVTCFEVIDGGASGSGAQPVSGSADGTLRVWDVERGTCRKVLGGHKNMVTCLAVVGGGSYCGGQRLVSGSRDKTVRVWDVLGGTCVRVLGGHSNWVTCLAVVGGGSGGGYQRVVSGSRDKTVRVWEMNGSYSSTKLPGLGSGIKEIAVIRAAGSAASAIDASCVILDDSRRSILLDGGGNALRHLPAPSSVSKVCVLSRGRVAWGTATGQVFVGQLFS